MKKLIFQEKNLVSPRSIFNSIGNERFGQEWTDIPLKVLGTRFNKLKISDDLYHRSKFMAREVWRDLNKWVKDSGVKIYADKKACDEGADTDEETEAFLWDAPFMLSCSSDLLLIERGVRRNGKLVKREFWIEMPIGKNPLLSKKPGRKPHDIEYLKKIFPAVIPLVEGKITDRSVSDAYKKYLKDTGIRAPSKTWVNGNLDAELKKEKAIN